MKRTCLHWVTESAEDLCLGCPTLLPLNDTTALNFVHASLVTVNNRTENITYSLLEVGRMSSQVRPSTSPPSIRFYPRGVIDACIDGFRSCLGGRSTLQNISSLRPIAQSLARRCSMPRL